MKKQLKRTAKNIIESIIGLLGKTTVGRYLYTSILSNAMNRSQTVTHQNVSLIFSTPNTLNQYRADTFSSKEPETLEWLDRMPKGSILWDIGANVGLYSCYAAKKCGARVFSFEPSVFNLELLGRNIFLNQLTDLVTIIPLPLAEELGVSKLNMTTTQWGGALSTFGQVYGHDGCPMEKVFEFSTIGLSMTEAVKILQIPAPNFVKMDVDGIEHLILKGGLDVLSKVDGVLIEINDHFTEQAKDANAYLIESGLTLKEKRHADYFNSDAFGSGQHTFNQIWIREEV